MNHNQPKNVSAEVETNLHELQNKIVHESDIDIIKSQTGIQDKLHIEKVLIECNNNISSAIIKLIYPSIDNKNTEEKKPQEPTVFEQIREILNDKEKVYYDVINKKNKQ